MEDRSSSVALPPARDAKTQLIRQRDLRIKSWPVAIIEDRYGGIYSGGDWLAIASAGLPYEESRRAAFVLHEGPNGDDCEAMDFWLSPPPWIAVGATPDGALAALLKALSADTASPSAATDRTS